MKKFNNTPENRSIAYFIGVLILLFGLAVTWSFFPELQWLNFLLMGLVAVGLAAVAFENRKSLKTRTAAFGIPSLISVVLVFLLLGVLNFIMFRYPKDFDLTEGKVHTLSDQTTKVVKGLENPVQAIFFSKVPANEKVQGILEKYRGLNPKFQFEVVDPYKEPLKAKDAQIKKIDTLVLQMGQKSTKVEDVDEEKLTNALIKMTQSGNQLLCAITGHREIDFNSDEADGYKRVQGELTGQAYQVQALSIPEAGKIPENCSAIAIVGARSAFFDAERKAISDYLTNGGSAVIAIDAIEGREISKDLGPILAPWHIGFKDALIVDPLSRFIGLDASVAPITEFSKSHKLTQDFQSQAWLPFSRPLEVLPGAPKDLTVEAIGKSSPKAWGETNFAGLKTGQVAQDANDLKSPLNLLVVAEGKLPNSTAQKKSRIVVFASPHFASNQFARFGGNLDLFVNAVSWILQDENLISIRQREGADSKLEMSNEVSRFIGIVFVLLIPILVALTGIVIWVRRRKL